MPEGVKKIEVEVLAVRGEVARLRVEIAGLRSDLGLLTSTLKEVFGLDSNGSAKTPMTGAKEYVT
jgi:hypothetical protein